MFETIFTGEHGFFRVWVMDKETGVIHELLESRHYEFTDIKSDEHVDFPGGPVVKNPPANAGDTGLILLWEDSTCQDATKPLHHN